MEECEKMDIDPILLSRCEDCGLSIVVDPSFITIYELDDEYTLFTLCAYCERALISTIPKQFAKILAEKKVNILSWTNNGFDINE